MEKSDRIFKGAGYLIGFIIGSIIGILFVVITGIEALIGAISGSIAIPLGIILENKFQGNQSRGGWKEKKILYLYFFLGILIFTFFLY